MNDQRERIRYLRDVAGLSLRQIAREMGISRHKVSRLYSGTGSNRRPATRRLDAYRDLIVSWFAEVPSLKAVQVFKRLQERGVSISRRRVDAYTEEFRRKKTKVYWPLTFLAGEEAQVDWFFVSHPVLGHLSGFTLVLSYSRYAFAHLFCRSSFEFFIEGHLQALDHLGGCPRCLRYDNLKSVVLKREPLQYNPSFLEFARHYGFEIRLCNPASGNEKGRVERLIRSIRDTFLNTAVHHQSLQALNAALHQWIDGKNAAVHRGADCVPAEKKKEETLKPLPDRRWDNRLIHPPKLATKTGLMIFDTNQYSVPEYATGSPLSLHVFVDRVEIFDTQGRRVAAHPRLFGRKQTLINPLHRTPSRLSSKAKSERIYSVIYHMDPALASFLDGNRSVGEDPYETATAIFRLLKDHSRGLLLSLIREGVTGKNCRLKFLLSRLTITETVPDPVSPQNSSLLTIDYQPRPLEDYDDDQ